MPTKPSHFAPIDGLRAISVLAVAWFHVIYLLGFFVTPQRYREVIGEPLLRPILLGHLGVDIFFVISGYLITGMLLREQESRGGIRLSRFYLRRALRILPAYIVVLFLSPLILRSRSNIDNAWANLLFVNNFLNNGAQALGWSWSLAIEEQFYLLLPIILVAVSRRDSRDFREKAHRALPVLAALFALAFIVRAALVLGLHVRYPNPFHPMLDGANYDRYFDTVYDKPYGRYGAIVCGVIVAYLERAEVGFATLNRHLRRARCVLLIGLCGIFVALWQPDYVPPEKQLALHAPRIAALVIICYRYVFAAVIAYVLFYLLARARTAAPSRLGRVLSWRLFTPIAELSYGAYLLHPLVIIAFWAELPVTTMSTSRIVALGSLALLITFALAVVLYGLVERPFRSWGRRL